MPVTVLFVLVTVAAIVANAGAAAADFTQADFALANSVRVGVPSTWLPALGTLKIAGAAGLLLGLLYRTPEGHRCLDKPRCGCRQLEPHHLVSHLILKPGVRKISLSWSPVTESNRRPSPYHTCRYRLTLSRPV
jgi:DoxX-like family